MIFNKSLLSFCFIQKNLSGFPAPNDYNKSRFGHLLCQIECSCSLNIQQRLHFLVRNITMFFQNVHNDIRVTVRVDKDLKENAEYLFERLGLNMSVAFNTFLRKAVNEDTITFPVSTQSSGFGNGLSTD